MKGCYKYKSSPDEIRLLVAASAAIASVDIANGRNIPVVFVPSDDKNKINEIISLHENIKEGNCSTSWGITPDKKFTLLYLDFQNPVKQKVILFFDIVRFGIVVEQIMHSQCMYLAIGDEASKLSLCMGQKRIFIDVYCDGFKDAWPNIFRTQYAKHLKRKYKISKKEALECFDKILKEWDILKRMRLG